MAQCIKLPPVVPASYMAIGTVLAAPVPIQLPTKDAARDGPQSLGICSHEGDREEAFGYRMVRLRLFQPSEE